MKIKKIRGMYYLVFSVCAVILCFTGCGKDREPVKVDQADVLKVMTINIWSGLDYEGTLSMGEYETREVREKRYKALLKEIEKVQPDVIGVNEANFLPDYVEKLAQDIDYDYIYHVGVAGLQVLRVGIPWNLKEGDAILARKGLKLEKVGRKQLSGGGFVWNNLSFHLSDATQVLVGKITWNKKPVYLAVTHWHASPQDNRQNRKLLEKLKEKWNYSDEEYREAIDSLESDNKWRMDEAKIMHSYLDSVVPGGKPLIVMGDFNAPVHSPEMKYFLDKGYYDTHSLVSGTAGYTWDPLRNLNIQKYYSDNLEKKYDDMYAHLKQYNEMERQRIDFVLIRDALPKESVVESSVCTDNVYDGVHPSDHFGVCAGIHIE